MTQQERAWSMKEIQSTKNEGLTTGPDLRRETVQKVHEGERKGIRGNKKASADL